MGNDEVISDLKRRTVRVGSLEGATLGTAFSVAPDGTFLTVAHVVRDHVRKGVLLYSSDSQSPIRARILLPDRNVDAAVLSVDRSKRFSSDKLSLAPFTGYRVPFVSFGYRKDSQVPGGLDAVGEIRHRTTIVDSNTRSTQEVLRLSSIEIDRFASGSAVVEHETGHIVGLIKGYWTGTGKEDPNLAFAVPIETFVEEWAFLKAYFQPSRNRPGDEKRVASMGAPSRDARRFRALPIERRLSLGRLPVPADTAIFIGREKETNLIEVAWRSCDTTIVEIVGDGGVGKSTLVWHWLEHLRQNGYSHISQALDWSFYSQGHRAYETDSGNFCTYAIDHFSRLGCSLDDVREKRPDQIGTALGMAFVSVGGLLVLDGLEPLQHPPSVLGGRVHDSAIASLLRVVRTSQSPSHGRRLLIATTRWKIPDLRGPSVLTKAIERLSKEDGAKILTAFELPSQPGIRLNLHPIEDDLRLRQEAERAAAECEGHPLSLVLLASLLLRYHGGNLRRRDAIRLNAELIPDQADPYRQARRILHYYESLLTNDVRPLSRALKQVLLLIGLFDRPVRRMVLDYLRREPAIDGLTDQIMTSQFDEAILELSDLRLVRTSSHEIDAIIESHPLVREHFSQLLHEQLPEEAREAHGRVSDYLAKEAAEYPASAQEAEPLLHAIIHACYAKRFRYAFRELLCRRLMRDDGLNMPITGMLASIVSVLSHFFIPGSWRQLAPANDPSQELMPDDKLRVLMEAGSALTPIRGYATHGVLDAYSEARSTSRALGRPKEFIEASYGVWRFHLVSSRLDIAQQHAIELWHHAEGTDDPVHCLMAKRALCTTEYYLGRFAQSIDDADSGIDYYRKMAMTMEKRRGIAEAIVCCYSFGSLSLWHLGRDDDATQRSAEAVRIARALGDPHAVVLALTFECWLREFREDLELAQTCAEEICNITEDYGFGFMVAAGAVMRGWSLAFLGQTEKGLAEMEAGAMAWRETGARLLLPYWEHQMALLNIALNRFDVAMKQVERAILHAVAGCERWWLPELHRTRAELLTRATDIVGALVEGNTAQRIAAEIGSVALGLRAERTLHCIERGDHKRARKGGVISDVG